MRRKERRCRLSCHLAAFVDQRPAHGDFSPFSCGRLLLISRSLREH